ncbi:ATP synthase subunit g, mitochondrial [Chelonus insularis]|uniref:ATP synthase subunit g, mitochondrial n=1 Tax=Chelonus insularis TaxID=460826 RepID=UPI00158D07A6|nr:ATP synthase subunit g, mitochondrial [Chelonus insularis]
MSKLVPKMMGLAKGFVVYSKPHVTTALRYAKVELTPPTLGDIGAARHGLGKLIHSAKSGAYKQLTVREAWINTLVGIEIWCWFFIGECIGKRHLVGYKV